LEFIFEKYSLELTFLSASPKVYKWVFKIEEVHITNDRCRESFCPLNSCMSIHRDPLIRLPPYHSKKELNFVSDPLLPLPP